MNLKIMGISISNTPRIQTKEPQKKVLRKEFSELIAWIAWTGQTLFNPSLREISCWIGWSNWTLWPKPEIWVRSKDCPIILNKYSEINGLRMLMLSVSCIRELQPWKQISLRLERGPGREPWRMVITGLRDFSLETFMIQEIK